MEAISNIIRNILGSIYQITGASLVTAVLFSIVLLYAEEIGCKKILRKYIDCIKNDKQFRWKLLISFYVSMILYRTVLCRPPYYFPLSNVMGGWSVIDADGNLQTDGIENLFLFIPYSFMVATLWRQYKCKKVDYSSLIGTVTVWSLGSSLFIEFVQLMLRAGTFQLADLFYNTLGGFIGVLIYVVYNVLRGNNDGGENDL